MDVATPLDALPEPTAPGHYVELHCEDCGKTLNYPWNDRRTIEVLPPGT
jgi:hypothetical protein